MTALALELCCTLMADKRSGQKVGLAVTNKVLPQALMLIKSSLLQGQALQVFFMQMNLLLILSLLLTFCFVNASVSYVYIRHCRIFLLH